MGQGGADPPIPEGNGFTARRSCRFATDPYNGTPKGTRTPICSVKGCRPKPVSRWAHIIVAIYVRWATTPPRH